MVKISIIIPIYNTGEKLYRCLDSVKLQTFFDFECLMIDDGSTDESPAVIDSYAADDVRFLAVHKKNGGVSSARNVGLDKAKGEWIVFLDSDDVLQPNHLEILMSAANPETDIVFTGYDQIANRGEIIIGHQYKDACYTGIEEISEFLSQSDVLLYMIPWDRMYRHKRIIDAGIKFDTKLSISEDRLFCYHYLMHTTGITTVSEITYRHDASDMNSLSFRGYNISVNTYRHDVFVDATKKLVLHYTISEHAALLLWQYVWSLLVMTLSSIYDVKKNIFAASKKQSLFFEKHFGKELYDLVKCFSEVKDYMSKPENQIVLNGKFLKWNFSKLKSYILYKLHISR